MTKEEACKAAEVMLAYADGECIEYKSLDGCFWIESNHPQFNWVDYEYHIKSNV